MPLVLAVHPTPHLFYSDSFLFSHFSSASEVLAMGQWHLPSQDAHNLFHILRLLLILIYPSIFIKPIDTPKISGISPYLFLLVVYVF